MIQINAYGGYDALSKTPLPDRGYTQGANIDFESIDESQCLLIKTFACGVNYADVCIRWGLYSSAKEFVGLPITPGFEFSGYVVRVGADAAEDFKIGDKVVGVTLFGGYSQKILVPVNQVCLVPDNLSMSESAGLLTVGLTAWYAVFEMCRLREEDYVLVHSAAGGVGSMLVQMLKRLKCNVIGVVGSTHKVECARALGCHVVIDKSVDADMWTTAADVSVKGFKAVFDANGVETLQQSYNHLAPGGRLISYGAATMLPKSTDQSTGQISLMEWAKIAFRYKRSPTFNPMEMTSDNKSLMCFNLSYMFAEKFLIKQGLSDIFSWVADGTLQVAKVTEYKLDDVGSAHRDLESGQTVGKLVLLTQNKEEVTKEMEQLTLEETTDNLGLLC